MEATGIDSLKSVMTFARILLISLYTYNKDADTDTQTHKQTHTHGSAHLVL